MEYRYDVRSMEKTAYVFSGTKREEREGETTSKLYRVYLHMMPQASNIPLIEPISYPVS
jgi:hypothetical protein